MMCHRQDFHLPLHLAEENRERKPPEVSPSNTGLTLNRLAIRILTDLF